jgi:hypothetical protein
MISSGETKKIKYSHLWFKDISKNENLSLWYYFADLGLIAEGNPKLR